jgi:hypothetical protein
VRAIAVNHKKAIRRIRRNGRIRDAPRLEPPHRA